MAPETVDPALRVQLTTEREHVVEQLSHLGHEGAVDSYDEHFADKGQVTAERGEVEALSGRLLEALTEIDNALAKLDDGTYGSCEACGGAIAEARLAAMPTARHCISCASAR
jgi:RNA polymerase-binding transcription factor DksA